MLLIPHQSPSTGILVGLVGGPVVLVWGLRKVSEKRLVENTPTSRVRSAAMGLVELSGIARPHSPLKSPLTGLDACWWQCVVEERVSDGKNTHWRTIREVSSNDWFYLEDPTG